MYKLLLSILLLAFTLSPAENSFQSNDINFTEDDYGYVKSSTIWCNASTNTVRKRIYVCWENPEPWNRNQRRFVQNSINSTWGSKNTPLSFVNWKKCKATSKGIRILIKDSHSHTRGLGNQLNGKKNGMVLNFTFKNWAREGCKNRINKCIKCVAVHEFGHAIGFAHEQNRPDTPAACKKMNFSKGTKGDIMTRVWDKNSVMNYCNRRYYQTNCGLSQGDLLTVNKVYGKNNFGFCQN